MSDYTNIARECRFSIQLSAEEAAVVLKSYDYGISALSDEEYRKLNVVVAKMKDRIWP